MRLRLLKRAYAFTLSIGVAFSASSLPAQTAEIAAFSPARYSLNNSATTTISVRFSQSMDGASITSASFVVYGERSGYHTGNLSYNSAANEATFVPDEPFSAGERITVTLTQDITTSLGASLAASFQWAFYIRAVSGTATFTLDSVYTTSDGPHFVGVGDFNDDASLELAIPHSRSDDVLAWLNDGSGGLIQNDVANVQESPRALTIGDFDADQDLDIAVANEVSNSVSILDNDGTGNFTIRASAISVGLEPAYIVNGDLNGDGFLDLITADNLSDSVTVLMNLGDGTFAAGVRYAAGDGPQSAFLADLDDDGFIDLAVANGNSNNVSILFNDGSGAFSAPQNSFVGIGPRTVRSHDFNLDGRMDLVVSNRDVNTITVLLNLGNGVFSLPSDFPVGQDPFAIATGDLDGDLDPDVVVTGRLSNNFHVLLNNGQGFFQVDSVYTTGAQPRGMNIGDFNGDGVLDVGVANWDDDRLQVFFNEFSEIANLPPGAPALISPANDGSFNPNSTQVTFTWNVPSDADGDLLHFTLEIDDAQDFASPLFTFDSRTSTNGFTPTPPVAEGSGSVSFNLSSPLEEGEYYWRVSASDDQASGPSSQPRRFTIDSTPPAITNVAITNPDFLPNWYNPNVTTGIDFGAIYDEVNADRAQYNLDALGGVVQDPDIDSGFDVVAQTPVTLSGASDDSYPLSVTIFDKAGNQASRNTTIALDGTPPTGARASSPSVSSEETFTVSWTAGSDGAGSGLSGRYNVRVQINGGPWEDWMTGFQGASAEYPGQDGNTYAFEVAARDNVGNVETFIEVAESVTTVDASNDVSPPGPPVSLTANGLNPSPWQNSPNFLVSWQPPNDQSGINRALYKIGAAPVSNFDTTASVRGATSTNITIQQENGQDFHLWFEDGSGNVTFQNRGSVTLRYDVTPPTGTQASSPTISANRNFNVSWGGSGTDGNGSGLNGIYEVRVQTNGGAWTTWLTDFQGTSSTFDGEHGSTYGFEVAAHDVAGNVEAFLDVAESTTEVDTAANDADAPPPPTALTSDGVSPSIWQNTTEFSVEWQEPADPSGIARALYKLGPAPTANFDTTASVTGASSTTVTVFNENGEEFHLWFEDGRGNVDFQNRRTVLLRYDATAPDIVEIGAIDPTFAPHWYNPLDDDEANIEINYDELHLQKIQVESAALGVSREIEPGESGIDVFFEFEIDIEDQPDGLYEVAFTLLDSAGNSVSDTATIALDSTPPAGATAVSPDTSGDTSFLVSWGGSASDGDGSGLSGRFNVRFQENGGPWQDWLNDFFGTSRVFNGEDGNLYGFEAAAIDNLENTESFTENAETVTLVDTSFADVLAPSIFHTQPLVVDQGQDVTLSAQVEDNTQVEEVTLFYKQSGDVSYVSQAMTNVGGSSYEVVLTADQISTMGINYFIRASDGRNFAFHPIANAESLPNNLSVRIVGQQNQGLTRPEPQPAGDAQQSYRMISLPINADNKDPLDVLQDDLGAYDRKQWRLFQYERSSDSYTEFPEVDAFAPGTALWLIVRDQNKFIDTGLGTTIVTNQPFEITLNQGWNDIGIPFLFPVSWNDVQVVQGSEDDIMGPYYFDDVWRSPEQVTTLEPWEGYAIFSETAGVRIAILPVASATATAKAATDIDWFVEMRAASGQLQSSVTRLGVSASAATEWDRLDYLEPPHIADHVSIRFPHPDWPKFAGSFISDFRPPFEDGQVWRFEVASTRDGQPITVSFGNLAALPADLKIVLYDNETLQRLDLRDNSEYTFAPDERGPRTFDLVIGNEAYVEDAGQNIGGVPESFFLSQNFPNPFNAGTSLLYKVSEPTQVEIQVLNVLGQVVKRLISEKQEPGTYRVHWDGTANDGRAISSGVYMIRFEAGSFQQTRKVVLIR